MTTNKEMVYGLHAVEAVLTQAPETIRHIYFQEGRREPRLQGLYDKAIAAGVVTQSLPRNALDILAQNGRHQGAVAECYARVVYSEGDLIQLIENSKNPPLFLVLDQVQDPHNLGACLRSADAAGVTAVIAPKDRAAAITPIVRKVASGAAESVPFIQVTNLATALRKLRDAGVWIYGLASEASNSLYLTDLTGPVALVLGAEGEGLRRLTRDTCDQLLHIPMAGPVASLNVSVAAGVCLFETVRQRLKK